VAAPNADEPKKVFHSFGNAHSTLVLAGDPANQLSNHHILQLGSFQPLGNNRPGLFGIKPEPMRKRDKQISAG